MTLANFTKRTPWKAKRNKMNAVQVHDPEHGLFHSKREHQRFHVLRLRERAGEIRSLKRQVPYLLEVNGKLVGKLIMDFTYDELVTELPSGVPCNAQWQFVDEDCKGYQTDLSKWQHKLFEAIFGRSIRLS